MIDYPMNPLILLTISVLADIRSQRALSVGTYRLVGRFLSYNLRQLKFVDLVLGLISHMKRRQYVLVLLLTWYLVMFYRNLYVVGQQR